MQPTVVRMQVDMAVNLFNTCPPRRRALHACKHCHRVEGRPVRKNLGVTFLLIALASMPWRMLTSQVSSWQETTSSGSSAKRACRTTSWCSARAERARSRSAPSETSALPAQVLPSSLPLRADDRGTGVILSPDSCRVCCFGAAQRRWWTLSASRVRS
eukprot:1033934-Rhodomonas_salina.1